MATHDYTRMSIDIPNEEHRKLKAIAALRGVSMKVIILECLSRELYSENIPNKQTEKTLKDSDKNKNIKEYKDLEDLRSQLEIQMLKLSTTKQFEKDVARIKKQQKNTKKLSDIVEKLVKNKPLPAHNRNHKLKGNYVDRWECHIAPDWLLIYKKSKHEIRLERTGSHSDLFR